MKGISFLTFSLLILLSFTVLTLLTALIHNYYNQVLESNIKAGLKQIAAQTINKIIYLYDQSKVSDASPKNSSSILISSIDLNYPLKVGGKNFEVELISSPGIWNVIVNLTIEGKNMTIRKESTSSSKVIVRTTQKPILSYEQDVPNIPIKLQGMFKSGGNGTLRLIRYNFNGTIQDVITLGEPDLIIIIKNIS